MTLKWLTTRNQETIASKFRTKSKISHPYFDIMPNLTVVPDMMAACANIRMGNQTEPYYLTSSPIRKLKQECSVDHEQSL